MCAEAQLLATHLDVQLGTIAGHAFDDLLVCHRYRVWVREIIKLCHNHVFVDGCCENLNDMVVGDVLTTGGV